MLAAKKNHLHPIIFETRIVFNEKKKKLPITTHNQSNKWSTFLNGQDTNGVIFPIEHETKTNDFGMYR